MVPHRAAAERHLHAAGVASVAPALDGRARRRVRDAGPVLKPQLEGTATCGPRVNPVAIELRCRRPLGPEVVWEADLRPAVGERIDASTPSVDLHADNGVASLLVGARVMTGRA